MHRWFDALDPRAARAARPGGASIPALVVAVAGLVAAVAFKSLLLKTLLPVMLAAIAVVLALRAQRSARARVAPRPRRGIGVAADRLAFESEAEANDLLFTDAPFGVTLLADRRRERLIALMSSSAGTFSVGAALDETSKRTVAPLLEAASTAVGDDLGLDAIGPDGQPLLLSADDFAALLDVLSARNPSCLERFVLSDTRGTPITLDGSRLQVGDRLLDLGAPLEWRSLVFEEAFGHARARYQGTWVRQGAIELVLVSLLPSTGAELRETDIAGLDRGALRDLRLMQAAPEAPPPSEQRVAIERLFMLPLRAALDRAPRASHQPDRAQA